MTSTSMILNQVLNERLKQDAKWGPQSRSPVEWMSILMEEVGEASQCANVHYFPGPAEGCDTSEWRKEMIQSAAVCIAIIEQIDNGVAAVRLSSVPDPDEPEPDALEASTGMTRDERDNLG